MIEPAIVPDVFASGMAEVEDLGDGNIRFTYYTNQKAHDYAGTVEHIIVARLVLPFPAVLAARMQMTDIFGCYCGAMRHMKMRQ